MSGERTNRNGTEDVDVVHAPLRSRRSVSNERSALFQQINSRNGEPAFPRAVVARVFALSAGVHTTPLNNVIAQCTSFYNQ